jgi:palmitoyl-protein thioesterase
MGAVKKEIEKTISGVYVYSIEIGTNQEEDELSGFIGNVNDQVAYVCKKLKADPNLAGGFNALGFSQGGQFLRAYVERCNDPPVYNLITFGGQHQGVSDIPECVGANKTLCEMMAKLLGMGAYTPFVRDISVQAQYFKDPVDNKGYIEHNAFLADINNARPTKNALYKQHLVTLNRFVMIMFENDTIVVPRISEYFGSYKLGSYSETLNMTQSDIYIEDWIGLKVLNEAGRIVFLKTPGEHMRFTMQYLHDAVIVPYLTNSLDVSAAGD